MSIHATRRTAALLAAACLIPAAAADPLSLDPALPAYETAAARTLTLDTATPPWHFLPFFAKEARDAGYELPEPLGITGTAFMMEGGYNVKELRLALGPGGPVANPLVSVGQVRARAQSYTTRLDAWVLPFLDVYALVGYTTGTADTTATVLPPLSPTGSAARFPIHVHYEGPTYGGGVTLAWGYKQLFAKLDMNYTYTALDFPDSPVHCYVVDPRIGWRDHYGPFIGSVWVGAMYQRTRQTLTGTFNFLPGAPPIPFAVDQEAAHPWNFLIGTQWEYGKNLTFLLEGGLGDRRHIMFGMGLRF